MSGRPFKRHTGIVAPLLRPNVDTDAIIPSLEILPPESYPHPPQTALDC